MPIQSTSIALIQEAGQTLQQARQALEQDVQTSAHLITAAILQTAGKDLDQIFAGVKEVARLLHDLQALEGRLKDLYLNAVSISEHRVSGVSPLLGAGAGRAMDGKLSVVSEVQDVEPKSEVKTRKTSKAAKRAPVAKKAAPKKQAVVKSKPAAPVSAPKLNNEQKLLAFLKSRLNAKSFTKISGVEMRDGSGLPAGSISASLGKLTKQGVVEHKDRGFYRLVKTKA